MKFIIKKNDIIDVLSRVQGITGRKSNLVITENILIHARYDKITIFATDLETGFEGSYQSKTESDGIVTINSKKIYEIVKNFPSDDIGFEEVENKWLRIGNKNVLYNIVGMDPADFPEIPHIDEISFLNINSYNLKKMIEKSVMIGASTNPCIRSAERAYFLFDHDVVDIPVRPSRFHPNRSTAIEPSSPGRG